MSLNEQRTLLSQVKPDKYSPGAIDEKSTGVLIKSTPDRVLIFLSRGLNLMCAKILRFMGEKDFMFEFPEGDPVVNGEISVAIPPDAIEAIIRREPAVKKDKKQEILSV